MLFNYFNELLRVILYFHWIKLIIMPSCPQRAYFQRVKEDHQQELAEDYVEEIARMHASLGEARSSDLAERFGVSVAAVSKVIQKLKLQGLVEARPYRGIFLTDLGNQMAEKVALRHDIVFNMLIALGVPNEIAHCDTEGIEHHCSEATVMAMRHFLQKNGFIKSI